MEGVGGRCGKERHGKACGAILFFCSIRFPLYHRRCWRGEGKRRRRGRWPEPLLKGKGNPKRISIRRRRRRRRRRIGVGGKGGRGRVFRMHSRLCHVRRVVVHFRLAHRYRRHRYDRGGEGDAPTLHTKKLIRPCIQGEERDRVDRARRRPSPHTRIDGEEACRTSFLVLAVDIRLRQIFWGVQHHFAYLARRSQGLHPRFDRLSNGPFVVRDTIFLLCEVVG